MFNLFKAKNSLFVSIVTLILFITNTAYTFSSKDVFESTQKEALSHKEIDPLFIGEYQKEMKDVFEHKNAAVDPSIKYVWVLAGRSSYLKEPVDSPDAKDLNDDYDRLELGIQIAGEVVTQQSHQLMFTNDDIENYGPQIIYNGRPKHNDDLKKALKEGILTHYPEDKFLILDLPPEEWNSRGQFMSLKQMVPISDASIAIVTHAYHFPRVARMVESKWNPFGPNTKVFFYLVDRELKAPGIQDDMIGEMKRIPTYIKQGDLTSEIPAQIHY